jgi:cadmium resistance protein CadD (predicted permease)
MAMREVHKRYLREFLPAMAAYVVLIFLSALVSARVDSVTWRVVLALLPLLPILLAIRAMVRVVRDQDELERRIDLEAFAISAMATGFGFFSFGLLMGANVGWSVSGQVVAIWVMPCLFASFGIAKLLVLWRYRSHE